MPISIGIFTWNGDVRTPNHRYTVSRVRIRGQLGRRDIAGWCEWDRVRMYGTGDGRVGVETAQTVGEDDGRPG